MKSKLNGNQLLEVLQLQDLYDNYKEHRRLGVFVHKGRKCIVCGVEGTLLLLTEDKGKIKHVDLFTDNLTLMTVDHIIPMSISKDDSLNNKQPMCEPCNAAKDNNTISNDELAVRVQNKKAPQGYFLPVDITKSQQLNL